MTEYEKQSIDILKLIVSGIQLILEKPSGSAFMREEVFNMYNNNVKKYDELVKQFHEVWRG